MATTADDVWRILAELAQSQKETERIIKEQSIAAERSRQEFERNRQETDRRFQQMTLETDRRFQETNHLFRESDLKFQQLSQEVNQQISAVSQEISNVNQQINQVNQEISTVNQQISTVNKQISAVNKQISSLGGKWGRFVENIVAPSCETIFLDRGIDVHQVSQRVRKRVNGDTLEIDVLVTNQDSVLVVEVKSSLGVEDVKDLIVDLKRFRQFFPEYEQKRLYGAVAGIEIEGRADIYATNQGLFVLKQKGEAMGIVNTPEFQPKTF
ncbi:DUF3782 domain-containing protein [Geminocystis sp. CENA526]|uniref:DUF3782 domain-containing protein n=1 Tax=Geminocystis sp. CENA526 TaxID=1355871 RepID=UPI003D6DEC1E